MIRPIMLSTILLVLASGCEHERNWLFDGEWIDIDGWGREADEACAGTFEYFDDYSGMLAAEFDINEPLGVFRWSSEAHFDAGDIPCSQERVACAQPGEAHSPRLPHEHEVVHLANFVTGFCPSVLAEGLAVYYDTRGNGSASGDLDLLTARLAQPDRSVPAEEYAIAGRFAAFLVHEFGLAAVLEVCSTAGRYPDAVRLSSAMEEIMGASATELVEQLAAEPDECNEFSSYQAKLYACGEDPLAPHAGIVEAQGEPDFVATYSFGCDNEASIGTADGQMRFIQQIEFAESDIYYFHFEDSDENPTTIPPVTMDLARCGYCGQAERVGAGYVHSRHVEAGRYWMELRAPADFVDTVEVTILHQVKPKRSL
jgi:hypothetical protein